MQWRWLFLPVLGGLVPWASPLFAQDYIDVEAERLREQQGYQQPVDPSYNPPPPQQEASAQGGDGVNAGELYYQLQLLKQEVMELRGKVEEQEYQLKQLKDQSLERYMDLDRRLSEGGGAASQSSAGASSGGSGTAPTPTPSPSQPLPGETDAYRAAYGLVRSQQFDSALASFRQFLVDYPQGKFAPNAHYWLGELYLVVSPPDEESARREFSLLLERYPDNGKIPDTLYKLGKIYFDRGDKDRAREYLDRVVNEFGDSGSSAVKLARDFISRNY
jgi:tol-pal system protein YbgF